MTETLVPATDIVAWLVQPDEAGHGGWGSHIRVTIAPTPAADAAAAAFFARACHYVVGEPYNVSHLDEEATAAPLGPKVEEYFFPLCEHGMSLQLCCGPNHYPSAFQERAWGWA